ncbi:sulfurtransferase [Acidisphaera sp. L21]|uniref:sulfurtransferase n=1 Tax=Acidisphaera sp. L21 TaxID=1641851 RepID=UPI00131D0846|nr:sulfurtransferase [Acidisphaera sp. L21]
MPDKILISPAELTDLIAAGGTVLIDTRSPENYAAGHIAGAVNMFDIFTYLAMSTKEGMAELKDKFTAAFGAAGIGGDETVVFYEGSMNSGFGMSCRGYYLLSFLGYSKAHILHGGLAAWQAAGLEVTTEVPSPAAKSFPESTAGEHMMLDKEDMLQALENAAIVKLDVRDVDEWIGTSSSPYGPDFAPRKGRIPGAKWLEWYRLMKPTAAGPMFKSKDELLAELHTVGVKPETPVYLYCFKGARASNSLVALHEAGIKDVRMYFGSWNEWSRDPALPIETGMPHA